MSDYFQMRPSRSPDVVYPSKWSPFPVRFRRVSNTAHGEKPHWVAVALSGRGKDDSPIKPSWLQSCYAVTLPVTIDSSVGAGGKNGRGSSHGSASTAGDRCGANEPEPEPETAEIETLLRRSLPGARLHRVVRLQDRGRWLRFVCERDGVISSSAAVGSLQGSTATGRINDHPAGPGNDRFARASESRLFADPRDVLAKEALAAIEASPALGHGGKTAGRTIAGGTALLEDQNLEGRSGGSMRVRGRRLEGGAAGQVRCSETARFAAMAFSRPSTELLDKDNGSVPGEDNTRMVAIVRAITGVSRSCDGRLESAAIGAGGGASARMADPSVHNDPFCGMEPMIDDLTRVGGIGVSTSVAAAGVATTAATTINPDTALANMNGVDEGGMDSSLMLPATVGLSSPSVNSLKTWESLEDGSLGDGEGQGVGRSGFSGGIGIGIGGEDFAVYTLRRDACYPEYLVTFSFPPHGV